MKHPEDNDDEERLIKAPTRDAHSSRHEDGVVDSIERCPTDDQLDTQVLIPSTGDPRNHYLTVEPLFFLLFCAGTIQDPVVTNLLLTKVCLATNVSSDCFPPPASAQETLQPMVADIQMFRTLLECAFPAFLSFFLGPWSDVNGRKPIILCSVFGIFICNLAWVLVSYIPDMPPIAVLVTSIPVALSGGIVTFYLGSFCYISDVTSIESRALRMGFLQVSNFAGLIVGNLSSAPLVEKLGYHGVFVVSASLTFLALVYAACYLRESIYVNNSENRKRHVFDCELVADMLATCCKRRPYYIRASIFLIMLSTCLFLVSLNGEMSVLYLSLIERFHWTLKEYTRYNCFSIGMIGIGTFLGLWLSTLLKIPDMLSALLVLIIKVPTLLIYALTTDGRYFYLGAALNLFGCCLGPLIRSHLSKIVPKQDLGKVFALTASAESLTPIAAAPLYTYVYKATMASLPGAFYYLSTCLNLVTTVLIFICLVFQLRNPSSLHTLSSSMDS